MKKIIPPKPNSDSLFMINGYCWAIDPDLMTHPWPMSRIRFSHLCVPYPASTCSLTPHPSSCCFTSLCCSDLTGWLVLTVTHHSSKITIHSYRNQTERQKWLMHTHTWTHYNTSFEVELYVIWWFDFLIFPLYQVHLQALESYDLFHDLLMVKNIPLFKQCFG